MNELNKNNNLKIVDLFGGSLFMAYMIKYTFENVDVIVNDYDNYVNRLNHAKETQIIARELLKYFDDKQIKKGTKATAQQLNDVLNILKKYEDDPNYYVDYLSISTRLVFSGNYFNNFEDLQKYKRLYNRTSDVNIDNVNEYKKVLDKCEIVRCDYLDLFNKYKDNENVLFIADPPYLYTDKSGYNADYWKFKDSLNVLNVLKYRCLFFTSSKSGLNDVIDWMNSQGFIKLNYNKMTFNRPYLQAATNDDILLYNL